MVAEKIETYRKSVLEYQDVRDAVDFAREEGFREGYEKGFREGYKKSLEETRAKLLKAIESDPPLSENAIAAIKKILGRIEQKIQTLHPQPGRFL